MILIEEGEKERKSGKMGKYMVCIWWANKWVNYMILFME